MTRPPPPSGGYPPPSPSFSQFPGQQPPQKKRKKWPWVLGAIVLLVIVIAVATSGGGDNSKVISTQGGAPTAPVDTSAEAPPNPIGSTIQIKDSRTTFNVTVQDLVRATPAEYGSPPAGTLYQVTVTIQGVSGTVNANPLYLTARAADGTRYDAALGTVEGGLAATTVPAGDTLRGTVGFDVTGPPIKSIRYEGALGQQLASWVVP